ncbi:MAG: hypothetical protein AAB937_00520 [Patescibacteria group bacterium]
MIKVENLSVTIRPRRGVFGFFGQHEVVATDKSKNAISEVVVRRGSRRKMESLLNLGLLIKLESQLVDAEDSLRSLDPQREPHVKNQHAEHRSLLRGIGFPI